MKAIIKATGEYVEVSRIQAVAGNNLYKDVNSDITYLPEELESIEQIRIKASIAVMQSYISDGERMALVSKKFDYDDKVIFKFIAEGAVMYADALIAELQKKGDNDETAK